MYPHVYLPTIYVLVLKKLFSLETYMNHDLDKFRVSAITNKLSINPNKSHSVISSLKCNDNMNSFNDISRNYGKSKILIYNCCKYLEILVDSNFNFALHIKSIKSKVARPIRIISELTHLLPTKTLLLLYHTIVRPQSRSLVWNTDLGDTYPTCLRNLIVFKIEFYALLAEANGIKELLNITLNFTF